MSHLHYIIRNYRHSDFEDYARLIVDVEKLHPGGQGTLPLSINEKLERPNYSPEHELFVVEAGGKIVGYLDMTPELNSRRVILDCFVSPEHRRRGVAKELLGYATQHAKELKAKVMRVNIGQENTSAEDILTRLGFRFIRRFLELRLVFAETNLPEPVDTTLVCRRLHPEEVDKLTRIQNLCFANHWGYSPNTTEEITYYIKLRHNSPENILLIYDESKLVGYCWTWLNNEAETVAGKRKGRIYMLGVDPDCRGQEIGKIALLSGLAHLKSKGVGVVELTVDSENRAANALYSSAGFKTWSSSLWYEKKVD
jgi:mycothiol synthase